MKRWTLLIGLVVAVAAVVAIAPVVLAQGPGNGTGDAPFGGGIFGPGPFHGRGPGFGGPMGMGFPMGGPEYSLIAVAAEQLGMEPTELVTELQAGRTVAELAEERGVALQTIVDAFVAPRAERLAGLVAEGRLTQEQADEMRARRRPRPWPI